MSMFFIESKLLLLYLSIISSAYCIEYDYTKVDFCDAKLACDNAANTACNCKFNDKVKEITTDVNEFRKRMAGFHNDLRDHLAGGKEMNNSLPEAKNMHVLNYDLELEHLARCWLMGDDGVAGKAFHDKCRYSKGFEAKAGQNLAFWSDDANLVKKELFHIGVQSWYDEVKEANDVNIGNFDSGAAAAIGHFTQVAWATATHLGCARGCKAEDGKPDGKKCSLVCNYAGSQQVMNCLNKPVYSKGTHCTDCGTDPCNEKYKCLCGAVKSLPQDSLKALSGQPAIPTSATVIDDSPGAGGADGGGGGGKGGGAGAGGAGGGGGKGGDGGNAGNGDGDGDDDDDEDSSTEGDEDVAFEGANMEHLPQKTSIIFCFVIYSIRMWLF